jgi:hypothetical protein
MPGFVGDEARAKACSGSPPVLEVSRKLGRASEPPDLLMGDLSPRQSQCVCRRFGIVPVAEGAKVCADSRLESLPRGARVDARHGSFRKNGNAGRVSMDEGRKAPG